MLRKRNSHSQVVGENKWPPSVGVGCVSLPGKLACPMKKLSEYICKVKPTVLKTSPSWMEFLLLFCLSLFYMKATTASCTTTVIRFVVLIKLQTLESHFACISCFIRRVMSLRQHQLLLQFLSVVNWAVLEKSPPLFRAGTGNLTVMCFHVYPLMTHAWQIAQLFRQKCLLWIAADVILWWPSNLLLISVVMSAIATQSTKTNQKALW